MAKTAIKRGPISPATITVSLVSLLLREHRKPGTDTANKKREDFYYDIDVKINDKPIKGEVHLVKFGERGEKGFQASIDLNRQPDGGYLDCIECNGNEGRSGPHTSGDTAKATFPVISAAVEKLQGVKIAKSNYTGGWYLFNMRVKDLGEVKDDQRGVPRFYSADSHKIDCPVHGVHVQRMIEFNA